MASDGSAGADDLAEELRQALAQLSKTGAAVTGALGVRRRVDTVPVRNALASVRRATGLLSRVSAMLSALEQQEGAAITADPVDVWARAVATAIDQADPVRLGELAEQVPPAVPPMIVTAARAAAAGDWDTGRPLADYVLGRIVRAGLGPELGRVAAATAVLAARAWMTGAGAPQRCRGYLQLAESWGGTTARLEAALTQMQRTTGDLGLAQDSAVHACSMDPGYPRGHVELALALAAAGSDPGEAVRTAAETASVRDHPYEALTDLVGGLPDTVLLHLAQACRDSRPEVARRALDELLTAAEPRPLSPGEDRRETVLRQVEAYRLRAALPRPPGAGTGAADLFSAASLVSEFDEDLSRQLLTQVLTSDPQHRDAGFLLGDLMRFRAEQAVPKSAELLDQAADQLDRAGRSPTAATSVEWERRILASLLLSQASARPRDALGHLLQAGLHLERSVLDGTASVWLYLLQLRVFYRLDLWSWAGAALERAARLSPDEPGLWEEQVLFNVNTGAYDVVAEQTAGRALSDTLRAARAIALAELGDASAAVDLLAPLAAQADAPMWYRAALARAYALAGQHEAATAQLEGIVTGAGTQWSQDGDRAVALLRLGRLKEAEESLREWWPEPSDRAGRQWRLALCRLVREPDRARESLLAGLEAEAMPSMLDTAAWEFDAVGKAAERLDAGDPRRAQALAVLQDARKVADRRLHGPRLPADRRADLQRCLRLWLKNPDGSDDVPAEEAAARTLATALTARLTAEESDDAGDLVLYDGLRGTALEDVLPDILRRRSAEVRADLTAAVSRGDQDRAHVLHRALMAAMPDPAPPDPAWPALPDPAALDLLLAVQRGDLDGIRQAGARALAAAAPADVARSVLFADLSVDQGLLLRGLAAAADGQGAANGQGAAESLLAAVGAEIGRRVTENLGQPVAVDYDMRRLVAELGTALVPEDTSSAWKLFRQDIPAMRERVKDRLGLTLPGVLVRIGDMAPYAFRVLLDGLEVMAGELSPDAPDENADGVPAPERLETLTEAIERTVLAAPGSFMSLAQLELLVRQVPAFGADVTPDPVAVAELAELTSLETMVRLTQVLRALLDDGLHVRELTDLVTLIQRAGGLDDGPAEIARRIRGKAVGHLIAARPGARGVRLPEDLESEAAAAPDAPSAAADIVDLLVRTWPEILHACQATEMPVIVVGDEPTRAWLQRVLRDRLLPGVAVTTAEVPGLAAEVPAAWRSPDPLPEAR